jgi:CRP-like cAMP-binding protein
MEFDNSVFRQVYEGCQDQYNFYSPDFSTAVLKNSRIPDFRNTLLWKPDLQTRKDGKAEVTFFTSDEISDFTIVVEGITPDGKTGYSSASFSIK